jgi:hypothetical protein
MVSDTETIFFPGNQRVCSEAEWFRSYAFNFGEFGSENRTPFGPLVAVCEHSLKEGRSFSFKFSHHANALLIPIVGELHYSFRDLKNRVDVGQSSYLWLPPATPLTMSNEYTSSPIQFLEVRVHSDKNMHSAKDNIYSFELADGRITPVATSTIHQFFIGKLSGRQDAVFEKKLKHSLIFIYEVSGTCEVHNRLLLPGDGLSLTNVRSIQLEALTPEAIVFIAEVPLESTK